jgi:hypothetical protein
MLIFYYLNNKWSNKFVMLKMNSTSCLWSMKVHNSHSQEPLSPSTNFFFWSSYLFIWSREWTRTVCSSRRQTDGLLHSIKTHVPIIDNHAVLTEELIYHLLREYILLFNKIMLDWRIWCKKTNQVFFFFMYMLCYWKKYRWFSFFSLSLFIYTVEDEQKRMCRNTWLREEKEKINLSLVIQTRYINQ